MNDSTRLDKLEKRVRVLEQRLPITFSEHIANAEMDSTEIVREWLKFHECLYTRQLVAEIEPLYGAPTIRQAVWRLHNAGELERITPGLYRSTGQGPIVGQTRLTPEQLELIKQDTRHSHYYLAAKYGVSEHTIRKTGHQSPRRRLSQ